MSKSPRPDIDNTLKETKSRNVSSNNPNTSTLQLSTLGSGNTLQSVLRSQKELKKHKNNQSSSRIL